MASSRTAPRESATFVRAARSLLVVAWFALALTQLLGEAPEAGWNSVLRLFGIASLLLAPWIAIVHWIAVDTSRSDQQDAASPEAHAVAHWPWILALIMLAISSVIS